MSARHGHPYCPCYCEENIWQLAGAAGFEHSAVVLISNARRAVALWGQRLAAAPGLPVVWDYHVVLVQPGAVAEVFDLDTALGWPLPLSDYLEQTFGEPARATPDLAPLFRLLPAQRYRALLSSDRSHMRAADGSWLQPPPPWPPIQRPGEPNNVLLLSDMSARVEGEVLDLAALRARTRRVAKGAQQLI